MSSILGMLMSHRNSYFERSNISYYENRLDGVDLNSNDLDDRVRKNRGKILWLSADCVRLVSYTTEPLEACIPAKRT